MNKIKSDIAQGLIGCDELPSINEKITKLAKESRIKLAQSDDLMPADFTEALEEALVNDVNARAVNNSGEVVELVLKAKLESLMAMTNDSDIPIVAVDDFIAIKE